MIHFLLFFLAVLPTDMDPLEMMRLQFRAQQCTPMVELYQSDCLQRENHPLCIELKKRIEELDCERVLEILKSKSLP